MNGSEKSGLWQWWQTFEQRPRQAAWFSIITLSLICVMAFLWGLGSVGLVDETEPLFAEASRQMTVTGDWVTPYFNGVTRFDKPPLVYWLMALGYLAFGVNEWTVRLPSALAAIALVLGLFLTLYRFGYATPRAGQVDQADSRRSLRQRWIAAWLGAAMLALNVQMFAWGRTGVSDMLLNACIGVSLLCFFWGYVRHEGQVRRGFWPSRWYLGCYGAMALAVLTKGPVGIVIPGLVILVFLFYTGNLFTVWQEAKVWSGLLIFAVITIPWYVLVIQANGESYINDFFGYHNLDRFTRVVNQHSAPWYFYFLVVLVGFLPWSVSLPLAIARLNLWQRRFWCAQPRQAQLGLLAVIWVIVIFGFFTVAVTKLPSYTLPLLPAAAILVAQLWSYELSLNKLPSMAHQPRHTAGILITGVFSAIFAIATGVFWWIFPSLLGPDTAAPNFSQTLDQSLIPEIGGSIWIALGIAIAFLLLHRKTWRWVIVAQVIGFFCFLSFTMIPTLILVDQERQAPLRHLAILAGHEKQPTEELFMIGFRKPSVSFYAQTPIHYFSHAPHAATYVKRTRDNPPDDATSILILANPVIIDELYLKPQDYQTLDQEGAYQLVRVPRAVIAERNDIASP
ncbi:ArnT family glycosyltransferase [Spirulina major]|uniref:ArnT family glycosyltransferase n=1 Tax=Spirulina major TaxID=270636 RepID=UPI000933F2EC|nr:glycosyltransferase family 39 protein [Spirulina major]